MGVAIARLLPLGCSTGSDADWQKAKVPCDALMRPATLQSVSDRVVIGAARSGELPKTPELMTEHRDRFHGMDNNT